MRIPTTPGSSLSEPTPRAAAEGSFRRNLALALGFGVLCNLLGLVRFSIPGVEGGISDLREIPALISVFHLQHWGWTIVVSVVASLMTPAEGSTWSTIVMHAPSLVAVWFVRRWLASRLDGILSIAGSWILVAAGYYYLLVLPIMVATNRFAGLLPSDVPFAKAWSSIGGTLFYEFVSTALVTSLYAGIDHEIRRRLRTEEALRESEARLRAIFSAAPVAIGTIEGGRFRWFNRQLVELTGRPPDELEKLAPEALFEEARSWRELDGRAASVDDDGAVVSQETVLLRPDRSTRTAIVGLVSLRPGFPGAPVVFTALDVTEQKGLERQLRQAQKMEAIGQLAGSVAHDFNNYLNVIQGFAEILGQKLSEPSHLRQVHLIVQSATSATNLCRQLLAFSRKQATRPELFDVNGRVERSAEMLRPLVRIDLELRLAPDLPTIRADPGLFEQVLMNLAVNARDAIRDHPDRNRAHRVVIETSGGKPDDRPGTAPTGRIVGQWVRVAVRDTGVGISPEVRERIFEPFFSTKPEGKGTGLGLSTVYGIVQQHGGVVTVQSQPGEGTSFETWWPAEPPGA